MGLIYIKHGKLVLLKELFGVERMKIEDRIAIIFRDIMSKQKALSIVAKDSVKPGYKTFSDRKDLCLYL